MRLHLIALAAAGLTVTGAGLVRADEPLLPPPPPLLDVTEASARCQGGMELKFFPSRGELMAEESSRVYFQATCNGREAGEIAGVVVASDGGEVSSFRSDEHGRGSFELVPSWGTTYTVRVVEPAGIRPFFALPPVRLFAPLQGNRARARPGFHFELQPRWGLFFSGLSVFAATSLINLGIGLGTELGTLAIPLYGPFYIGGVALTCRGSGLCGVVGLAGFLLVVDGLAQVAGLTMMIVALAARREVEVRDEPSASVVPLMLPGGGGLAVAGRF